LQNDGAVTLIVYTFTKGNQAVVEGSTLSFSFATASVVSAAPVCWRFGGSGTTAWDFSDGQLEESILIGTDSRAGFSKQIAADGVNDVISAGDRIGLRGASSDSRLMSARYGAAAGLRMDALLPAQEAIGFVQRATLASFNHASAAQFVFA
jgi:hypothetical protein